MEITLAPSLFMPIVKDTQTDNVRVLLWRITESDFELREMLDMPTLSLPENAQRRLQRMAVYNILKYCQLPIPYTYDNQGRPLLTSGEAQISISHTRLYAAVAICQAHAVGIDIEQADRNFQRVAPKYLSDGEQNRDLEQERLAATWCVKEAVYKLPWPKPLVLARDVEVEISPSDIDNGCTCARVRSEGVETLLRLSLERIDGHILAWTKM